MNKHFVYFESQKGGMQHYDILEEEDFRFFCGWMSKGCEKEDRSLLKWMLSAEVGEYKDHRLGTLVRLKDFE